MMRNRLVAGRVVTCVAMAMMCVGGALGQAAAPQPQGSMTFDAATVKLSPPPDMAKIAQQMQAGQMPKFGPHVEAGRAEYTFMTLKDLIAAAYKVKPYQISGPAWMTPAAQRFDIVARMPEGATKDDAPTMLQALLKDRFKVTAHRATEEHPVLALIVSKGGPKMKVATEIPVAIDEDAPLKPGESKMETTDGPARISIHPDGTTVMNMGVRGVITYKVDPQTRSMHIDSKATTMTGFADVLTQLTANTSSRIVVDQTGLKGYYQVSIEMSLADMMNMARSAGMNIPGPAADASDQGSGTSVLESVEALGLKLDSRKAPIEQLVVDSGEKAPTEN